MSRHELSNAEYAAISPLLPGKEGDVGRSAADNRLFVNGVLWILRTGAPWRDLPERYGKWNSVYQRFRRWAKAGVWEEVFERLRAEPDMEWVMLDSSIVRAHQHSAGQKKKEKNGQPTPAALMGRSRGGASTKLHVLLDALGNPRKIILSAGQTHDIKVAPALVKGVRAGAYIGDKAYDSEEFIESLKKLNQSADIVIPTRSNKKEQRQIDENLYKDRNKIERWFNRIKQCRRVATRYDKQAVTYLAFVYIAAIINLLK